MRVPIQLNKNSTLKREPEYTHMGTVSILAGVDLQTGLVTGTVFERHRSKSASQHLSKRLRRIREK